MATPEQIGITATLVVVIVALVISSTSYLGKNTLLIEILAESAIAISIAFSVWFITTKKERKNRRFVRNQIVKSYLEILSICAGLVHVPERRVNMNEFIRAVSDIYETITSYCDTHSHLLDAEEIKTIFDERNLVEYFGTMMYEDPNNENLIQEFYTVMIGIMRRYIKINKVTDFNVNEYGAVP